MGHNRIPIQKWFRDQAMESMAHATTVGEKSQPLAVTLLLFLPSLKNQHSLG